MALVPLARVMYHFMMIHYGQFNQNEGTDGSPQFHQNEGTLEVFRYLWWKIGTLKRCCGKGHGAAASQQPLWLRLASDLNSVTSKTYVPMCFLPPNNNRISYDTEVVEFMSDFAYKIRLIISVIIGRRFKATVPSLSPFCIFLLLSRRLVFQGESAWYRSE